MLKFKFSGYIGSRLPLPPGTRKGKQEGVSSDHSHRHWLQGSQWIHFLPKFDTSFRTNSLSTTLDVFLPTSI